jgi:Arc/MetJ-type ribon-helix-helix transcriptional regulator
MKRNRLGFFLEDARITVRLPEPLRDMITDAAIEERRSMAEVIAAGLFDYLWRRKVEKHNGTAHESL